MLYKKRRATEENDTPEAQRLREPIKKLLEGGPLILHEIAYALQASPDDVEDSLALMFPMEVHKTGDTRVFAGEHHALLALRRRVLTPYGRLLQRAESR